MLTLAVNLGGLCVAGLIVWWFWLARRDTRAARADEAVAISVSDGVYRPARIEVPAGRPVTLRFLREDASPSAGVVSFPALGLSAELPLGAPRDVVVTAREPGEYDFSCQAAMYRGTLVAR